MQQTTLRDQKRGRDEAVWYADDVLPDMGAERGKRVRDAAENTCGDLTGYLSKALEYLLHVLLDLINLF